MIQYTNMLRTILSITLNISVFHYLHSQVKDPYFSSHNVLSDETAIYVNCKKRTNASNNNRTPDGYFHDFDFCLAKFDLTGKKLWEVVLDRNRDCGEIDEMKKRENYFYTCFTLVDSKPESSIYSSNHYLIKFDSLGKILLEKKIDSTFYSHKTIVYTDDFIYILLNKDSTLCQKYDYNFNLLETTGNTLITSFLYESKVFPIKNHFISVGPLNDMTTINKDIRVKNRFIYKPQPSVIKKTNLQMKDKVTLTIRPLPGNETASYIFPDSNQICLTTRDVVSPRKYKLYSYHEKTDKLQLITDTLSQGLLYFKPIKADEFLFVRAGLTLVSEKNQRTEYPRTLYHFRKGNLVAKLELDHPDEKNGNLHFFTKNNKLLIYKTYFLGNALGIKTYDYK